MINLIRNELSKIFHRKTIYVFGILILISISLNTLLYYVSDKFSVLNDYAYSYIDSNLDSYDLSDPQQLEFYVNEKTMIDIYNITNDKGYVDDSWEYYAVNNDVYDIQLCINQAIVSKDEESLKECEEQKEVLLKKVEDGDWKYFVEIKRGEDEFYNSLLDYRLEYDIPFSNNEESSLLDSYVEYKSLYDTYSITKNYKNYNEKLTAKEAEKNYYETKYIIENKIEIPEYDTVHALIKYDFSSTIFLIIIGIIVVSGSIVADEFNKGTIKQLLLRPYSRTKILMSKYISCLIVFVALLLFRLVLSTIIYGFLNGWSSLSIPVIMYNFNTGKVMELSIWTYILIYTIGLLPLYLILLSLAFTLSVISGNNVLAVGVSIVGYIAASIINTFANSIKYSIVKFFPTLCWDLTPYWFGGLSPYRYSTFGVSLVVDIVVLILFIAISIFVFNRKEIKNQ